jgi:acetolactate decarboxylase
MLFPMKEARLDLIGKHRMPTLTITIPPAIEAALHRSAESRGSSVDGLISTALSAFLNIDKHRAYQVSTSAALVEGVSAGSIPSTELIRRGDFGLGTFENLDGEMVILDGTIFQIRVTGELTDHQSNLTKHRKGRL